MGKELYSINVSNTSLLEDTILLPIVTFCGLL